MASKEETDEEKAQKKVRQEQNKNRITTKIYPTTILSGNGFFYDNPKGSYIGDIKYSINNTNTITDIDKVNYVLKELFDYVKSAGKNEKIVSKEEDIDNFFISYKNTTDIIPKKYEKYTKKNQIKTGGKKIKYSKKNRKTRKSRKIQNYNFITKN
jgi:hypothetical protein